MKTAFIVTLGLLCMSLGACFASRDDGAGDLYKITRHCNRGNC